VLGGIYMGRSEETNVWLALERAGDVQIRYEQPTSDLDVVLNPPLKHSSSSSAYIMYFFWEVWEIFVHY